MNAFEIVHQFYDRFETVLWRQYETNTRYEYFYAEDRMYVIRDRNKKCIWITEADNPYKALFKTIKDFDVFYVYQLVGTLGQNLMRSEKDKICLYLSRESAQEEKEKFMRRLAAIHSAAKGYEILPEEYDNSIFVKKIDLTMFKEGTYELGFRWP